MVFARTVCSAWILGLLLWLTCPSAHAHPGDGDTTIVVEITIEEDGTLQATIKLDGRTFGQLLPASLWTEAEARRLLAAMADGQTATAQREALLRLFIDKIEIRVDGAPLARDILAIGDDPDIAGRDDLPDHRWGMVTLRAQLPPTAQQLQVYCWPHIQPLALTIHRPNQAPHQEFIALKVDGLSAPVALDTSTPPAAPAPAALQAMWYFGLSGFAHVLPAGSDHVLFVLGLVLLAQGWRPLLLQVTMFTLAHSVTIAVVAGGVWTPAPHIVEPLIALSIAAVAIENLVARGVRWWRLPVVFGFGLLHGLGFGAGLGAQLLPDHTLLPAIVGFNIGVELGQLVVVAIAAAAVWLVGRWRGQAGSAHALAALLASPLLIAGAHAVGLPWWCGLALLPGYAAVAWASTSRQQLSEPSQRVVLLTRPGSLAIAAFGLALTLERVLS